MLLVFKLAAGLLISAGHACDCLESKMDVSYSRATLVFYGEVVEAGTFGKAPKGATLKVSQWFKSAKQDPLTVTLAVAKSDCDLYFRVGEKWLIFAAGSPPRALQCGGSRLLEPKK